MSTRCVEWSSVLEVMRTRLERLWIGTGAAMLQHEKEKEQLAAERGRQTMLAAEEESATSCAAEEELKAEVAMLRGKLAVAETRLAAAARARLAASSGVNSATEAVRVAAAAGGAASCTGASPEQHATPTSLDSLLVSPPASLVQSPPSVRGGNATSASAAASDIVHAATAAAVRNATSPPAASTSWTGHSARVRIDVSHEGEMISFSCRVVIEASPGEASTSPSGSRS